MSVEVEHHHFAPQHVSHQFETLEQQNDTYIVGMWTFLVTEIMFFGGLFLALTIYRATYSEDFAAAHTALNQNLGLLNTFILLTSSFFMAMGVRSKMLDQRSMAQLWIGLTIMCALGFLVVKGFEYSAEFDENHYPGATFYWENMGAKTAYQGIGNIPTTVQQLHGATGEFPNGYQPQNLNQDKKQLFFSLYFIMTGLHGLHVLIGIFVLGTLFFMIKFRHPAVEDYMPIELAGLYWHFVDIVWIFLFPLIYLIGK